MKKIISLLLVLVLALGLSACKDKKEAVEEKPAGTYKTIGIYSDTEYTLKEDLTFTATDSTSGTYVLNTDGAIWFSRGDEQGFELVKAGDYYYRRDVNGGFDSDLSEDFLPPMFDEKGRTNQSFYKGIGTTYLGLDLKQDGKYYAYHEEYEGEEFSLVSKKEFEGTYTFKDDILWLSHGDEKYPMILGDDALYFDVVQKTK